MPDPNEVALRPALDDYLPSIGTLVKIVDATPPPPPVEHYVFALHESRVVSYMNGVLLNKDLEVFRDGSDRGPDLDLEWAKARARRLAKAYGASDLVWKVWRSTSYSVCVPTENKGPDGFCRFRRLTDTPQAPKPPAEEAVWEYRITADGPVEKDLLGVEGGPSAP